MFNGNRLREIRRNKGLSQQNLANLIGASKSLISCYESGKRTPSLENIISFMEIFGVTSDYLLDADNIVKTVENNSNKFKLVTDNEIKFIEELKRNKTVYDTLLVDPKKGADLIIEKLD